MAKINNQAQILSQKKISTPKTANRQLHAKVTYMAAHHETCTEDYIQSVIRRYLYDTKNHQQ